MQDVENTGELLDRSKEGVIKAFFDYDADTGAICWKSWIDPRWNKYKGRYQNFLRERAGKIVKFGRQGHGYLVVGAGGIKGITAHQIVWVLTYGNMPEHHIDHIDGNPENNKIENLRDVPQKINVRNQRIRKDNTSGVTGVCWCKKLEKWKAQISVDGSRKGLGYYNTIEEAAKAREEFFAKNPQLGYTKRHGKPSISTKDKQKENT